MLLLIKNFQDLAIYNEKCLENSECKTELQYQQPQGNNQKKKKRKQYYLVQPTLQQICKNQCQENIHQIN